MLLPNPDQLMEKRFRNSSGMSLFEMIAVVAFVSIFIGLILPQIYDVSSSLRDAETKNSLSILRHGVAHSAIKIQRYCHSKEFAFPPIQNLRENTLSLENNPCTEEEIPDIKDRRVFNNNLVPENFWGASGVSRRIFKCRPGTSCFKDGNPKAGIDCGTNKPYTANSGGWCYDESEGLVWANSAANLKEITENTY